MNVQAEARIRGVAETARRNRMMEALGRMAQFLESAPPDRAAYIHAIAAPEPDSKDYSATAILNHLPIEAVDAASDPDAMVEGAVHELGHYLYDYIPPEKHRALVNEFVSSGARRLLGSTRTSTRRWRSRHRQSMVTGSRAARPAMRTMPTRDTSIRTSPWSPAWPCPREAAVARNDT